MDLIILLADRSFKRHEFVFHKPTRRLCRVFEPPKTNGASYVLLNMEVSVSFVGSNRLEFIPARELTHMYSWTEWLRAIKYCSRRKLSGAAYFFSLACFVISAILATDKRWITAVALPILGYAMLMALNDNNKFMQLTCIFIYTALVLLLTIIVCGWF